MIGYYIHHVGRGHLHRALAVAAHLAGPVTALSSLPTDRRWPGPWLVLPRDDDGPRTGDPTAGGSLHWAPLCDPGLQSRMAVIAGWVAAWRPSAMIVDLSVEVLALARLMGVPVVTVTLPGSRADRAHQLGYALADAIVAPWPRRYVGLGPSLQPFASKVHYVGAISRHQGRAKTNPPRSAARRVLLLSGAGADPATSGTGTPGTFRLPGWDVGAIGGSNWTEDPWDQICAADVVFTHAGLGALADVAAAGRPAVVVPQTRPHHEQVTTATVLAENGLAVVALEPPNNPARLASLLEQALRVGGTGWTSWIDGGGAGAMAEVVRRVAGQS